MFFGIQDLKIRISSVRTSYALSRDIASKCRLIEFSRIKVSNPYYV
jgi:hypothetical protein